MRTLLIDKLIQSLNVPLSAEIDKIWAAEADRRVAEIESGKVEMIDGEEVFKEIRERFKK